MRYAEVSVNSPVAQRRLFTYSIPTDLDVRPGQAVYVPFGEKELQGIVFGLSDVASIEGVRDISGIIEDVPQISPPHLALARWISGHYLAPLFDAVSLMLPPGFERRPVTYLSVSGNEAPPDPLTDEQKLVFDIIGINRKPLKEIEKALGKKRASVVVSQLVRTGKLQRSYELSPVRIKPKTELRVKLTGEAGEGMTSRQSALYEYVRAHGGEAMWGDIRQATGLDRPVLNQLVKKRLLAAGEVEVPRDPISYSNIVPSFPLTLTPAQKNALEPITDSLRKTDKTGRPDVFLLHGVTGSGKTEVYLQALAEAIRLGKKGIVLVPEISLTSQTIERFAARFPHRVAVLHSGLSLGEQYDEWRRIHDGEFDVVIGPRSALFAPQPDLGLIVMDEEHEWTYKQDSSPRYHTRDAAIELAGLTGAAVVLGSATPDVASYYKAERGEYKLLELPERISVAGGAMPSVTVVDMREELKAGNRGMFSRSLSREVNRAVAAREQVILFLNRRGGSTFIQCRRCGNVLRCRRCEVPLSYHNSIDRLTCHQCGRTSINPEKCPECGSPGLKYLGMGTQKLEQEVRMAFPRARRLRWDSDTATDGISHEELLRTFKEGRADILIGTQMVAKGLDIPAVTLVGVMNADTALNLPDFRAGERTFQLLSQVAGRAGRGAAAGQVIIQTYTPDHYAVRAAAAHDYAAFYRQEMEYRKQLMNPPFARLARLVYVHTNEEACQKETERMKGVLRAEMESAGVAGIETIGPAPVFIRRLRGKYRWHIILRGNGLSGFLESIRFPQGWSIDIDPVSILQ